MLSTHLVTELRQLYAEIDITKPFDSLGDPDDIAGEIRKLKQQLARFIVLVAAEGGGRI